MAGTVAVMRLRAVYTTRASTQPQPRSGAAAGRRMQLGARTGRSVGGVRLGALAADASEETLTAYSDAQLYELSVGFRNFTAEVDGLLAIGAMHLTDEAFPIKRVLELAAGPGCHAIELARRGIEVVALDMEPAMQKHSLNKAKEAGVPLTYLVDDMTKFETSAVTADGGPVQLALMLFGSAVHLLTNDMVLSCLASVRAVLSPGGLLVLELEHPSDVFDVSQHAGSTWEVADPKSGGTLLTEWGREGDHFDPISQVLDRRVTFSECDKEGQLTRCTEVHMLQRRFTATEVDALARAAGWRVEAVYGGLELPHVPLQHPNAFRMIVVLAVA